VSPDATPWNLAAPRPVGPVGCPACRRPAALTAAGFLCACGAKQHPGEPIAPLIGELATAQAEAAYAHDALRAQPRIGVAVLLRAGPRLLVGLRRGENGGGTWSVPSGHVERGETPLACAARELAEETGIAGVELSMLLAVRDVYMSTYDGGHPTWPDYVTLWAVGEVASGTEARVLEPEKCERWAWVTREEMPAPLFRCFATLLASGVDPWSVLVVDTRRCCVMISCMGAWEIDDERMRSYVVQVLEEKRDIYRRQADRSRDAMAKSAIRATRSDEKECVAFSDRQAAHFQQAIDLLTAAAMPPKDEPR
jgi:8-oxo-dGTP diphosphatase